MHVGIPEKINDPRFHQPGKIGITYPLRIVALYKAQLAAPSRTKKLTVSQALYRFVHSLNAHVARQQVHIHRDGVSPNYKKRFVGNGSGSNKRTGGN